MCGAVIDQGGTAQTRQQDDGADEIKPGPVVENFPVHPVSSCTGISRQRLRATGFKRGNAIYDG